MASNIENERVFRTTNQQHHFKIVWTIDNFLDVPAKIGSLIRSPPLIGTSEKGCAMESHLLIHPRGVNFRNKEYVGVYLLINKLKMNAENLKVSFDISLINARNQQAKTMSTEPFETSAIRYLGTKRGYGKFISLKELRENAHAWLPGGHLTLKSNIRVHFLSTVETQSESGGIRPSDLGAEVLKMLYEEKICADVKLKASDGRVFDANKCILSVRSPYFKAMFQHPMKENEECLVDLSRDMNGRELEALLHYIYLGIPPHSLGDMARKMLEIGDMQGIQGLKQISEHTLIGQLTDDNTLDILTFANLHDAKELSKAAAMRIAKMDI